MLGSKSAFYLDVNIRVFFLLECIYLLNNILDLFDSEIMIWKKLKESDV